MPAAVIATDTVDVIVPIGAIVAAIAVAFVLATLISAVVRSAARRSNLAMDVIHKVRRPMRAVLVVVSVWIALRLSTDSSDWVIAAEHALLIALIISAAWLIGALAFVVEDAALARFRMDVPNNRHARRIRTQITVLRRLTVAILAIAAMAGVLMTFPDARAAGATLFASAGVITIVAGLAAQSSLANVFAGLQLAFTDAIRVDDVVIVDAEWGRIEEITMTYVVVHLWDDRRLIVPSTYFTTTPFQNWTRREANLLGTVELDVDWAVPVDEMRAELVRLLEVSDLWDNRVGVLQVTQATGGLVQVRALASAVDAPTLFDLRCYVREGLVSWVQASAPQALPRTRIEGAAVPIARAPSSDTQPALPEGPLPKKALELARPDDARPEGASPDSRQPDGARPDSRQPDGAQPDGAHPDGARPEESRRDGTRREHARPDRTLHDGDVLPAAGPAREPAAADRGGPDRWREQTTVIPATRSAEPPTRRTTRRVPAADETVQFTTRTDSRLFTGSIDAVERAQAFAGPGPEVLAEREQTAERALREHESTNTTENPHA
ncbi:mechanosensitive ion channel domain-containing protein [Pengzhenrongella phosphoraccumulans]|uniref:mechanosensitive ion channel family protein n=1 Tax=Pengzhenrongella phosphoraccumulans TaxID=3114394 RepID=UPI00388FE40F